MNIQHLETYFSSPTSYSAVPNRARNVSNNGWMADPFVKSMDIHDPRLVETNAADAPFAVLDEFAMLDEIVQHALQDAMQTYDLDLRWEAVAWLWVCCPDIAEQLLLTWPEEMPEGLDLHQKATAYLARYPA